MKVASTVRRGAYGKPRKRTTKPTLQQPLFWIHQGRYPLGHRVPDCGRNHVGRDWVCTGDCVRWLGEYGLCGSSAGTKILID